MSNKKPSSDIQTIGNPALIATSLAPAIKENAPVLIKVYTNFVRTLFIVLGIAGGSFLIYQWAASQRRKQLASKAGQDPDIKAAIDIYAAIPAGLRKGEGSILNPFGLISDLFNKIATMWQRTDTERILEISKRIKDNKRVFTVFRILYNEDLYLLLTKALSPSDLDTFIAHSGPTHSASLTPAAPKAYAIFTTKAVRIRKTPVNQDNVSSSSVWSWISNKSSELVRKTTGYGSNIIGTAENDMFLGLTTGREVSDEDGKTVFTEFKGLKKGATKWDTIAYVWKGAIRTLSKEQLYKEFGTIENVVKKTFYLDPAMFNGVNGLDIQIKSIAKATIYNEFMHPISKVGSGYLLGQMTGTLNTGTAVYIKFITTNGTVRYIDSRCVAEY